MRFYIFFLLFLDGIRNTFETVFGWHDNRLEDNSIYEDEHYHEHYHNYHDDDFGDID